MNISEDMNVHDVITIKNNIAFIGTHSIVITNE